jgi:hypothetical protein
MSKKFLGRIIIAAAALAFFVLLLLKQILPDSFTWYNLNLGLSLVALVFGVVTFLGSLSEKNQSIKKSKILFGGIFIAIAAIYLVLTFIPEANKSWILPIIGIAVVLFVFFFPILFTGGKKWDEGDNKKVGYKNYAQRKAEQEKLEEKEKK